MNIGAALSVISGFKNMQVTRSTAASAIAAGVVGIVGAALIAQNVMLPFVGLPLTAEEVTAAMWLVHTGVNAFTSDSTKEQIVGLAMKAQDCLKVLPTLTADYSITKNDAFAKPTALPTQAAAAVAVIQKHVADVTAAPDASVGPILPNIASGGEKASDGFPQAKNGA